MNKKQVALHDEADGPDRVQLHLVRSTGFELVCDITLPETPGVTVFFGPSGCGKTTILRAAAGLEKTPGFVRIGGRTWQDDARGIFTPTYERRIGYVFQEASLFSHMNVIDNLRYGIKRIVDGQGEQRLKEAVELLGIGHLLKRSTAELSGGERQRCAIARSLAIRPTALFMDEPLSALDQARRLEIMPWLERIKRELKVPILYVTHSDDEVLRLADQLVVMHLGKIVDAGDVARVWHTLSRQRGESEHKSSLIIGRVAEKDAQWGLMKIVSGGAHFWVRDKGDAVNDTVRVTVQSENVSVSVAHPSETSIQNVFRGRIAEIRTDEDKSRVMVEVDAGGAIVLAEVTARAAHQLSLAVGMDVWVQVKSVSFC